ncbi:heme peroxidase [Zopfia rhizophila CBS 207.26]|uniref:Heme peroxidase n=1 Tax=Zopfia rhizophila CBS 207.26 TaxID=1314779 RepID=A0A6A6E4U9_9PEZI|nr:heme peroxidase [Zopfia rhizophila CBS 207.26]
MTWLVLTLTWIFLAYQQHGAAADPTWPSSVDELEDIMFLSTGYRARGLAKGVTPCSLGQGPGRLSAAEWIRTAFHDMATGNVYTGEGGLDASIVFETTNSENIGPGFGPTLVTWAPFFSSRASMADIIAIGVYTATRSCGGPVIPVRAGRKDATKAGSIGIPLPENAIGTFRNQFLRTGYSEAEMIAFVACGHTLGGVHSSAFPMIVPANTAPNDYAKFDNTDVFDNKIAVEYLGGTSKDPLIVGSSTGNGRNSDARVFAADGNVTIKAMQNPETFASMCTKMFQKMIEVVPTGVTLTDPIKPYDIKPYDLQLTLLDGGSEISFTGDIRIRTTQRSVALVQLVYKDRNGASVSTPISTAHKGDASGFDDTFTFYGFSTQFPADTSISSFNVVITLPGGATEAHDNNGAGYTVDDRIMYQFPQSCLDSSGKLTAVAAVRNGLSSPNLQVVVKNPRPSPVVVPSLSAASVSMAIQSAIGSYQLYSATYSFIDSQAQSALFGVSADSASDNNKNTNSLPSTCVTLNPTAPSSTQSSSAFAYQGCYSDNGPNRALPAATTANDAMTTEECAAFCSKFQYFGLEYSRECYCGNALDASSEIMGATDCNLGCLGNSTQLCGGASRLSLYKNLKYVPMVNPKIDGYNYLGCYSEGTAGRALADSTTASDSMTVKSCAAFCNGAPYFGVEYGRECYCGAILGVGSVIKPASQCSIACAGNSTEYCGAANFLNLYQMVSGSSSSSTPTPTLTSSTLASPTPMPTLPAPFLAGYAYQGCFTDTVGLRTLGAKAYGTESNSYVSCATFCDGYAFFGVEYGRECFCGNNISNNPLLASESDCNFQCTGNSSQVCGAGNRLNVFQSNTATPPSNPSISGYNFTGCYTDSVAQRTLNERVLFDDQMTIAKCATFCGGTKYFGTEHGGECYCGNNFAHQSTAVPESDCSFLCPGNHGQYCGAENRLSLWTKS